MHRKLTMIKLSDVLIVYLACGAPFAVYSFFQARAKLNPILLTATTFFSALFWIFTAYRLILRLLIKTVTDVRFVRAGKADSRRRGRLNEIEKRFSEVLRPDISSTSLFNFRETFQRFAGLTIALNSSGGINEKTDRERDFLRISGRASNSRTSDIGAKCLARRNRNRLIRHQNNAQEDFTRILDTFNLGEDRLAITRRLTAECTEIFNDSGVLEVSAKIPGFDLQLSAQTASKSQVGFVDPHCAHTGSILHPFPVAEND